MEAEGYITRSPNEQDKRGVDVTSPPRAWKPPNRCTSAERLPYRISSPAWMRKRRNSSPAFWISFWPTGAAKRNVRRQRPRQQRPRQQRTGDAEKTDAGNAVQWKDTTDSKKRLQGIHSIPRRRFCQIPICQILIYLSDTPVRHIYCFDILYRHVPFKALAGHEHIAAVLPQ